MEAARWEDRTSPAPLQRTNAPVDPWPALALVTPQCILCPYAEGLLLIHSTRLECLSMKERRARARRGRRILRRMGVCLNPGQQADTDKSVKLGQSFGSTAESNVEPAPQNEVDRADGKEGEGKVGGWGSKSEEA